MNDTMEQPRPHAVPARTFIIVWACLIALTGVTVFVAGLHLGRLSILAAISIASVKAGLVLWFFMHLKYESRFFKLLLLVPVATLAVIIGLTFFDIWFR